MNTFNTADNKTNLKTNLTASPAYRALLRDLLGSGTVLLDTSTITKGTPFLNLVSSCLPFLRENGKTFLCPYTVLNEIAAHLSDTDAAAAGKAAFAMQNLTAVKEAGFLTYVGKPDDRGSGNAAIMNEVLNRVWKEDVVVLTQSTRLAADAETLMSLSSIRLPHKVTVKRIDDSFGRLESFDKDKLNLYRARNSSAAPGSAGL